GKSVSLETALRLCELLVSLAVIQRGLEHLTVGERAVFVPQILFGALLLSGATPLAALVGLWVFGLAQLHRYDGSYNGGADKMVLLIVTCLAVARAAPSPFWAEMALAYLGVQLTLSYAVSGWVKLRNRDWRSGQALGDVFAVSAYPVSEALRRLSHAPLLMAGASWAVIVFELGFPLALAHAGALVLALGLAGLFHLANACLFGLNRFFWAWISAFPALIWLQARLIG
ncbi:MAG: HTTM domain-containing protein, partial [Pseudomonadota bacterium]